MSTAGNALCTISALTPARKMLNIRRGETLTCRRAAAKNLYIVTAIALRVRQLRPFVLLWQTQTVAFLTFILLQGGVQGQGRF